MYTEYAYKHRHCVLIYTVGCIYIHVEAIWCFFSPWFSVKNWKVKQSQNVFFLISWDWSNTCYNAKVTTRQLCDHSALLSRLQRLRHKRQKETFSTVTFFFLLCNMYSVQKWDEMAPGNRRSQSLACWDIASDHKCVMRRSFMRQISKEMSKHQEIVSK